VCEVNNLKYIANMKKQLLVIGAVFCCIVGFGQLKLSVGTLTCEYNTNPLGVESLQPRLAWIIESSLPNTSQTAYQLLVSDSKDKLLKDIGNVWDSKKVLSNQSIQVQYKGSPLVSAKKYYWKVKVWNQGNIASSWSTISSWQMGLLSANDWSNAKWITMNELDESKYPSLDSALKVPALRYISPQFRKDILITKPIKSATAFVCGLGQFEMNINGKKVSDHFLDPGWTTYEKYSLYVPFDITNQL
jgi:hypothetical protein